MEIFYMSRREAYRVRRERIAFTCHGRSFFCFTSGVILLCPMPSVTAIGASKSKFWFGNFCELKD
jgi:hypothetical protein